MERQCTGHAEGTVLVPHLIVVLSGHSLHRPNFGPFQTIGPNRHLIIPADRAQSRYNAPNPGSTSSGANSLGRRPDPGSRHHRWGAIPVSFTWQSFLDEVARLLTVIPAGSADAALQLDIGLSHLMMRANRLGQLLLDEDAVTPDQLAEALTASEGTGQQLGHTLVHLNMISPKRLAAILHEQHERNRMGQLLLNLGMLTVAQLSEALKIQESAGGRLGEILITHGFIQREQMHAILKAKRDSLLLGQLLVSAGHITDAQLQMAMKEQADTSQLLGNILVQRGFCQEITLKSALRRQGYLNRVG
ncbi:MAG: hypothetical protein H7338_21910, partial [Candidatus Sericytochromatia bacterium]|nr:hypothetical protein [Candidatus Sericytochromatia bacterium]